MHQDVARVLLTEEQIKARIRELGKELMAEYADKNPVFVGVLKGVVVFYSDMIRAFDAPCQLDFMWISSYQGTQSTGNMLVRPVSKISSRITTWRPCRLVDTSCRTSILPVDWVP